jgi:hypothetical protein
MKIHKYKEMMRYLTRKPVTTQDIELARTEYQTEVAPEMVIPPQDRQIELAEGGRAEFADGTRLSFSEKQKVLNQIKKYVDKKIAKDEVVTLQELNEKFGQGRRKEYLYKEALGKDYDKITKLQREGVGRVSLEVKDKLYNIIDEVVAGKRPLMDLSRKNLNQELPPISERQLSKYLNENKKYVDYDLASNVDKVQQRIAKGNEKLKDATIKNIESKLEQTTANLRRPSPKRVEEFIVRDLVRHDNQGGELFKVLPKSNTKFYDKIKILDVENGDVLTTKKIKDLVDKGDPRFKEYKETFNEINQLKKTPYINPVTKEETNLLNALQQATGNKQPLNIDHLKGVKDSPLDNLAVSTYKANTGANIKDITQEQLDILGRKKFTPEQNIERLTKFADRRLLQESASGFEKVKTPLETLALKKSGTFYSDPTGIGNFLETTAGQALSKSAPNLLKTTAKLSAVTGTPINALLGVALYADEFKEMGLNDIETIAAGAYKGSTQDLLNFGDLIIRKLPVATYEKFVEDKPFLESLLDKPEYFEFADKQIDKYASEKSIKDRIRNRAEYEVRKSFSPTISETEAPVTATAEEYENLIKDKENEILSLDPNLKKQYKQETTVTPKLKKDPSQNLMLGPIVFPKYTQEELNFAKGGRVNFANGSDDPESDLYIPPLVKTNSFREGILNLATEGRDGFKDGTKDPNKLIPIDPLLQDQSPSDPGRRDVLKLGVAGAGILGLGKLGLLKLGSVAKPSVFAEAVKGTTAPSWMEGLMTKILKEGTEIKMPKESSIIKKEVQFKNSETGDVQTATLTIDSKSDRMFIEYNSPTNVADQPVVLELFRERKAVQNPDGKSFHLAPDKTKGYNFYTTEAGPRVVDWDGNIEFDAEDSYRKIIELKSDISGLKSYATEGKGINKKVAQEKRAATADIEKNPEEYVPDNYPDTNYYPND